MEASIVNLRYNMFALKTKYSVLTASLFFSLCAALHTSTSIASEVVPGDSSPSAPTWQDRYNHARKQMLQGDFAEAAAEFSILAKETTSLVEVALAREQHSICYELMQRGLTFVKKADIGESSLTAKALNRRTSDELATLYTVSVLYGLGTGGWLASHTKPESAAGAILPALGFAGASAGAIALLDNTGEPLRYGVAQSITSGLNIGLQEGLALLLWHQASSSRKDEWDDSTGSDVVWGFTTAGAVAGGVFGSYYGTTPGRASFMGSAALWTGTVTGLTTAAIAGIGPKQDDAGMLAAAIALNVGAIGGALTAGKIAPTIAKVRYLDLGGLAGAILAGGIYTAAVDKGGDSRVACGTVALGTTLGLGIAFFATAGMPSDRLQNESQAHSGDILGNTHLVLSPTVGGVSLGLAGTLF